MKIKSLITLLAILMSCVSFGARANTTDDFIYWNTFQGSYHINKDWIFRNEVQFRLKEDAGTFNQVIVRPSIGYQISKSWQLYFGFLYQGNYNAHTNESFNNEYRIFQEAQYNTKLNDDLKFTSRTRLEQRTYDYKDLDANVRSRQQFRLEQAIAKGFYLAGSDEVFVNLSGNQAAKAGFDQNRFWIGPGYYFTPEIKVEIGYINQYVDGVYGHSNQLNQGVSSVFYFNF